MYDNVAKAAECLETLAEALQTLNCDLVAPFKIESDGLQGIECLETLTEILQILIYDLKTSLKFKTNGL